MENSRLPKLPVIRRNVQVLKLPSAEQQARNALGAAARVMGAVITGGRLQRSHEEVQAILKICQGDESAPQCEQWRPDKKRCYKCGCYMSFKAKVATEKCPLGKWG